ncbi:MAG: hypothetical protein H6506_05120 [Calditrichaeota bacterium]|nr:hypothetical protein [Calditrichota bacterium]MCB9392017.1 hypothetical protein [Calditrichota bacterium]
MARMNKEQAVELICRRLHGDMSSEEAAQFDEKLSHTPGLADMYRQISGLDRALAALPELRPSVGFTNSVLRKIRPMPEPVKERATWLDWLVGLAPAIGVVLVAMIWGRDLWNRVTVEMFEGAGWLDQVLGTHWFSQQPYVLLAVLLPVVVLVVAYSSMQGKCCVDV